MFIIYLYMKGDIMKKFTRIIFCLLIFIFIFSIFSSQNFVNALNDEENDDIYEQNASSFDEPFAGINFDEWRIISLDDNNNPFLQKPVDYSTNPDLLKYVKKGDIIYESTFGSDILDYTNFIGHIALVVDIYYDEYYKLDSTKLYVSGGIGTNNFKFRFNNKPSINLYRLKNK